MAAQQHKQGKTQDKDQDATQEAPQGAEKSEGIDEDVDAILADIDEVLESNAEEFVKSYIQKGGQ